MQKKEYRKPGIEANAFAQFENVYTACDKNPSGTCTFDDSFAENGHGSNPQNYSSHKNLQGLSS